MAEMLSYDDALDRILEKVPGPLSAETVALDEARGRVIDAPVIAREDVPPFDNSAVDGYAINGTSYSNKFTSKSSSQAFHLSSTIAAGSETTAHTAVSGGWTARIMTGAPVPEEADRIVMLEDSEILGGDERFVILHNLGDSGDFIRKRGSDIARGATALDVGTKIGAGEMGLLAALNVREVDCTRAPYVGIVTTGDEVMPLGSTPLRPGQIRNANAPALAAAVEEAGGTVLVSRHARDTKEDVVRALADCAGCDVILTCGGVSVGEFDYVKAVAEEMGTLDFWRVAIKPGKPLAFGKIGDALFFGLPGNPVSALVTFELFVRPVLRKMGGIKPWTRPVVEATLTAPLSHEPGRREFARAHIEWRDGGYRATPTGAQGSHRLMSLVGANALLVAHEDRGDYAVGERLPAFLLG